MTQAQGFNYLLPSGTESAFHQYFAGVENSHFSVKRARFPGKHATASRAVVSHREIDHLAHFAHIGGVEPIRDVAESGCTR